MTVRPVSSDRKAPLLIYSVLKKKNVSRRDKDFCRFTEIHGAVTNCYGTLCGPHCGLSAPTLARGKYKARDERVGRERPHAVFGRINAQKVGSLPPNFDFCRARLSLWSDLVSLSIFGISGPFRVKKWQ